MKEQQEAAAMTDHLLRTNLLYRRCQSTAASLLSACVQLQENNVLHWRHMMYQTSANSFISHPAAMSICSTAVSSSHDAFITPFARSCFAAINIIFAHVSASARELCASYSIPKWFPRNVSL